MQKYFWATDQISVKESWGSVRALRYVLIIVTTSLGSKRTVFVLFKEQFLFVLFVLLYLLYTRFGIPEVYWKDTVCYVYFMFIFSDIF